MLIISKRGSLSTKKAYEIAILPGDGTGPDIIKATMPVIGAVKKKFKIKMNYKFGEAGFHCIKSKGTNLPKKAIDLMKKSDCVIKGPMTTPEEPGSPQSAAVTIRKMFDLYANVRPSKTMPNVPSIKPNVDLVIVRENTEGLYSGREFYLGKDTAVALRIITRKATDRIARFALKLAMERKRHMTYVHKQNILKISDGLFNETVLKAAKSFPKVTVDGAHVDAIAQWLIKQPEFYDVIVAENLFGDIISDEAAMVVGGLGVAPGANIGEKYAMFEPVHGSAPKYADKDKVNPMATILSVKMMMDWMGNKEASRSIQDAVETVLKEGKTLTYDLGGTAKCSEVGNEIASKIETA